MKKGCMTVAILLLAFSLADGAEKKQKRRTVSGYKLTPISVEMWGPIDINNGGTVLIERQLEQYASPTPSTITGKKVSAFQCPGTVNDTDGEAINNLGDITGHCGHQPGTQLVAFVANPKAGTHQLLSYPGAQYTYGFGINDLKQIVGVAYMFDYSIRGFVWNPGTGQYTVIDHPNARPSGGWTFPTAINGKGQVLGYHSTARGIPSEEFDFVYDNGSFTPVLFPNATYTQAVDINNDGAVLGIYSATGCSMCVFLYDDAVYFGLSLPLPANEPRPDGVPAGNATLTGIGGLNDKGQFVGSYRRTLEWGLNMFGHMTGKRFEFVNFVASPGR